MSLLTLAVLNGLLAAGILAALAYVCWLPSRVSSVPVDAERGATAEPDDLGEQLAA